MLGLYVALRTLLVLRPRAIARVTSPLDAALRGRLAREEGQTTAEYALVILAAAAIAIVLIAWARSSGKLPAFFDKIIDDITNSAQ
jgi:Flp pilus assembly pilin Flp